VSKLNNAAGITIDKPIHLMCAKESRADECKINGEGLNDSSKNAEFYQPLSWKGVDNVWIQGFTLDNINNGGVYMDGQNAKIIDCVFQYSQSPPKLKGAVVEIAVGSTAIVVDSVFAHNKGGAIQNFGTLSVLHTVFDDNESTPVWLSNDETENRGGGVGGAIVNAQDGTLYVYDSTFTKNVSDKSGPAIWSYQADAIDLGSNCGSSNEVHHLDTDSVLGVCDGIFYKFTHSTTEKGNLCASFGSSC
jgi:hypothetical protein